MGYDYGELRGLIRYKCKTLTAFAKALNISASSLNDRLQGKLPFKQTEISCAKEVLGLDGETLERIFFTEEIQKTV